MSVIVKGMEMPSGCQSCDFSDDETRFCKAAKEYIPMLGKPEFCPLVELPEKHGPLIDCQALLEEARRLSGPFVGDGWSNQGIFSLIARQPTIVESEGDD